MKIVRLNGMLVNTLHKVLILLIYMMKNAFLIQFYGTQFIYATYPFKTFAPSI